MDQRVPFPRRGLNDAWAFGDQPGETTRTAKNVRGVDPTNGRIRGAQRAGMSKFYANVVPGSSPVLAFESIVYDNKTIIYDAIATADLEAEWAEKTEPNRSVKNLQTDAYGNLYAVVEKTVEKRNPDGKLLWAVTLPVDNDLFTLGPLVIGSDLGVHVAVDGGAPGSKGAAVYRINQNPIPNSFDTEPQVLWTYQTDRWVKELQEKDGVLYVLEQDDVAHRCYVTQVTALTLAVPVVVSSWPVSWPATAMVVKKDGSVVTGHPYQEDRKFLPLTPGVTIGLESWTIEDLDDYENRLWSWYRAEDLVADGIEDGQEITFWGDRSGNGRHLYKGTTLDVDKFPADGPSLKMKGSFAGPSVYFDGLQGLFSQPGGGKDNQRDACLTMVPNHGEGAFCTFIVCRPRSQGVLDETDGQGVSIDSRRYLFQQKHHTQFNGTNPIGGVSFDKQETGAYKSGIILNSKDPEGAWSGDLYCWGGYVSGTTAVNTPLEGLHEAGAARAYTSSTGEISGASATPFAGYPGNQGATTDRASWTKYGLWDDPDTTEDGEGLTVFTFLHGGGLMECVEVTGEVFTAIPLVTLDSDLPAHIPTGTTVEVFIGGVSQGTGTYTVGAASTSINGLTFTVGDGQATLKVVPADTYEQMTRSLLRINGQPIDRWEALPMAYRGFLSAAVRNYQIDQNVAQVPTGVGLPELEAIIKGYAGEIVEMVTLGRRQTAADAEVLPSVGILTGGVADRIWHNWPTVLTHKFDSTNQDLGPGGGGGHEVDSTGQGIAGANGLTTEMEKIEGWLAHRYGIQLRLASGAFSQDTNYPHPHYPYSDLTPFYPYDIPLVGGVVSSGQAWQPRLREDGAMLTKWDQGGKMLWCLLSGIGSSGQDFFTEDFDGNVMPTGVDTRPTDGIALGPDEELYICGRGDATNRGRHAMGVVYDDVEDDRSPVIQGKSWSRGGASTPPANIIVFPEGQTIRLKVDEFGNAHIPIIPGTTDSAVATIEDALRTYDEDGNLLYQLETLGGSGYQNAYAVALPPENPDYYTD